MAACSAGAPKPAVCGHHSVALRTVTVALATSTHTPEGAAGGSVTATVATAPAPRSGTAKVTEPPVEALAAFRFMTETRKTKSTRSATDGSASLTSTREHETAPPRSSTPASATKSETGSKRPLLRSGTPTTQSQPHVSWLTMSCAIW